MTIPKINIFSYPDPFLFQSFPSSLISLSSILSPFRLHSVFSQFLSLPLSHFATSIPHMLYCLAVLIAHSAPSFISFHPISPSFFFLLHSLSSGTSEFPLSYTSHPVVSGFLDSVPSFLLVLHSSIFLLLLIFPLLHWHTRFSDSISLSPSSPCFFFSLQHSVTILHSSLPSILSSNFATLFPAFTLILFLLHSSLTSTPSTPSTPLKYFSCTFSTSSRSFHSQISALYINILSIMV
jgi:hypothetical protein